MGALQAQDFGAARWAIGVRLPGATDASVAQALSAGAVLRTHLFRGTWQLVAAADLRWMLELVAPRVLAARAGRERQLGLDAATFRRSRRLLERALAGGHRTREELAGALAGGGVPVDGIRLSHLLQRAELEGLACSGALRGRTVTYALFESRVPAAPRLARAEALRALALRHARGRGPVTASDLAWWAGITLRDAREGLEGARPELLEERVDGQVWWRAPSAPAPVPAREALLLPAFDEYLVGYRDRGAVLDAAHVRRVNEGGGMLAPCLVVAGRVVGVWRRVRSGGAEALDVTSFQVLPPAVRRSLPAAARRLADFLGRPVRIVGP